MSENNSENKNSLLVTGLLKVWDAERQNEKNKQRAMDVTHTAARMTSGTYLSGARLIANIRF